VQMVPLYRSTAYVTITVCVPLPISSHLPDDEF
jgi:hypothetical protein